MSETIEQVARELNDFVGLQLRWDALGENGRKYWGITEDDFDHLTHFFRRLDKAIKLNPPGASA